MGEKILWKSMGPINCLVTEIPQKYLILCSKEEIHTGLEQLDGD